MISRTRQSRHLLEQVIIELICVKRTHIQRASLGSGSPCILVSRLFHLKLFDHVSNSFLRVVLELFHFIQRIMNPCVIRTIAVVTTHLGNNSLVIHDKLGRVNLGNATINLFNGITVSKRFQSIFQSSISLGLWNTSRSRGSVITTYFRTFTGITFTVFTVITVTTSSIASIVTIITYLTLTGCIIRTGSVIITLFSFTRLTVRSRLTRTHRLTIIVLVGFWILFHELVEVFSKVKNLIFRFEFFGTVNKDFLNIRKLNTRHHLEMQIDTVNQVLSIYTLICNPEKVTGSKSGITLLEQIDRARVLTLYELLNASILKDVHKRMIQFALGRLVDHIH